MGMLRVNPTRMELTRLKKRLKVARRGHKLLKDKRDELMKQFLMTVRIAKDLRNKVESMIMQVHSNFLVARAELSKEVLFESLMAPGKKVSLEISKKNIMSVDVPEMKFVTNSSNSAGSIIEGGSEGGAKSGISDITDVLSYGFSFTSAELDNAVVSLADVMPLLLELASKEKSAQLMAAEIERTRRRVNALEYVMIPDLTDTVKYISMKLDENERGNITRLMKVKDMVIERARGKSHS